MMLPSILSRRFLNLSLLVARGIANKVCSDEMACKTHFGFPGYYMQKTGAFKHCHITCTLSSLVGLKSKIGWTCGKCYPIPDFPQEVLNRTDIEYLASDALEGRNNGEPSSLLAKNFLIDELETMGATGLNTEETGRDAYKQFHIDSVNGNVTSILGVLKGHELPDEYIVLSAHYDHVGKYACGSVSNTDSLICNGATDNAAGVSVILGIARAIAALPKKPRRSIVLAFWDGEEDGLLGSKYYVENPLFPLHRIVTLLNWDIQGSSLLPSLRNFSLATGAETGGRRLTDALDRAVGGEGLDMLSFSQQTIGYNRSDHTNFSGKKKHIPSILFTDGTNGCYHKDGDELKTVDFDKLEKQAKIGLKLPYELRSNSRMS